MSSTVFEESRGWMKGILLARLQEDITLEVVVGASEMRGEVVGQHGTSGVVHRSGLDALSDVLKVAALKLHLGLY